MICFKQKNVITYNLKTMRVPVVLIKPLVTAMLIGYYFTVGIMGMCAFILGSTKLPHLRYKAQSVMKQPSIRNSFLCDKKHSDRYITSCLYWTDRENKNSGHILDRNDIVRDMLHRLSAYLGKIGIFWKKRRQILFSLNDKFQNSLNKSYWNK